MCYPHYQEQTVAGIAVFIDLLFLNEAVGRPIQMDWAAEIY